MKHNKGRNFNQLFTIAILMVKSTAKRLLFSKKTIGIIVLCLIPILIFSLWHAGVLEAEDKEMKLYANIPDLAEPATDDNISVSIDSIPNFFIDFHEKKISLKMIGTTTGSVDHLTIKLYIYLNESIPIYILNEYSQDLNESVRGPIDYLDLKFIGTGPEGDNDWRTWEFIFQPTSLDLDVLSWFQKEFELNKYGNVSKNEGDDQNKENPEDIALVRLGIYVRAYSDNFSSEQNWTFEYKELYLEFNKYAFSVDYLVLDPDAKKEPENGYEIFFDVALPIYFLFIIPLIALLYSISAIREDIEKHTIVYLITRPISKTEILFYKFKGYFISAWIPLAFSISVSFFIAASKEGAITLHLDYLGTMLLLMTLIILAYGALFFIFSNITSYPIVLSLLYVYFWETTIWQIPNSLSRLSILYHIQCMVDGLLGEIAEVGVYQPFSTLNSFLILICATVGFLVVAIIIFNKRDFE